MSKEIQKPLSNTAWVAIEGTDGVGKTELFKHLSNWFDEQYPEIQIGKIDEFSQSPIGHLIQEIVNDRTFFMLGDQAHYSISETLVLAADFLMQREVLAAEPGKKKGILLSDRGIYSFFVYQGIRLRDKYNEGFDWNNWINEIFSPFGKPELSLCLVSPIDQVKRRLIERGDNVTTESLQFIQQAQDEFLRLHESGNPEAFVIIENVDGNFDRVVREAQRIVKNILISELKIE